MEALDLFKNHSDIRDPTKIDLHKIIKFSYEDIRQRREQLGEPIP